MTLFGLDPILNISTHNTKPASPAVITVDESNSYLGISTFAMIGDSLAELVFIRACIVVLHSIAPLSIFYCAIFAILQPSPFRLLLPFELYAASEAAFYFVVYLPRKHALQKAAEHPTTPTQEERRELFQNCFDTVTDPERYLVLWFRDCPLQDIKRDNVKELFSWAFLNKADYGPAEELELEEYADKMEKLLGYKLAPGRGTAVPIKLTFDKAEMLHRSLLWYFVSVPVIFRIASLPSFYMTSNLMHARSASRLSTD